MPSACTASPANKSRARRSRCKIRMVIRSVSFVGLSYGTPARENAAFPTLIRITVSMLD
jgi:hypothetical protein